MMRNKLAIRIFGLYIVLTVVIFAGIIKKNRGGPPAVLAPVPLPPIQNDVAPPSFILGIKEEPTNRNVGEIPVINASSTPHHSQSFSSSTLHSQMVGRVNYDLWWNVVGYFVDDLRIFKNFPNQPDERKTLVQLHVDFHDNSPYSPTGRYGHKVYGYFLPPKPGVYLFKLIMDKLTAAAAVELWISPGPSPLDTKKCIMLEYDDLVRRITNRKSTTLNKEADYKFTGTVHYFEYLMKAYEGMAIVDLLWKPPGHENFVPIPSANMAMAVQLTADGRVVEGEVAKILHDSLPSSRLQTHHRAHYVGDIINPISDFDVLPQCEFSAQYAYPRPVKAYTGPYQVQGSKVYPKDDTWFKNWHNSVKGNPVIEKEKVDLVMLLYKEALNKSTHKGHVSQLINMEETINEEDGSRFLLELVVELTNPQEFVNISEYVYLKNGSDKLCHTSNFQWQRGVKVYLVVTVTNLSFWINHLMQNLEEIFTATKDDRFHLIVTDFGSEDANVEDLMSKSSFKNWNVISKTGGFSKSAGLQAAIDYVTDPDSIVMTIDMHLTLPTGFIKAIRQHTIQGKMAYTPYFFRLNMGYTEINFNGFWETEGYGLFGMFKSDWTTLGGFNLRKYKDEWGGEDWDVLDRSLAKGYEAFRVQFPGLVHYHHAPMWGGKTRNRPLQEYKVPN